MNTDAAEARVLVEVAQTSKSAVSQVSYLRGWKVPMRWNVSRAADLEIGDTAGLETCATTWRPLHSCSFGG